MQSLLCFLAGLQLHDRTDTPLRLLRGTAPAHGAPAEMLRFSESASEVSTGMGPDAGRSFAESPNPQNQQLSA